MQRENPPRHSGHPDAPEISPIASEVDKDRLRSNSRTILLVLLLAAVVKLSFNKVDPDLWGHVRYGRDVLSDVRLHTKATYTYAAPDYPWINHENLAEVVFGVLWHPVALMLFKCAMATLVVGLMLRAARDQQAKLVTTCVVVLLAAMNMTPGWAMRPQIFTYTFFAVLIVLLDRCYARRRVDGPAPLGSHPLWWAALLFFVWANTHGGFVAGYCIFALYVACRSAETLWRQGRTAWQEVRTDALVVAACGLLTLVNPYGPRLHLWLIRALGQPRPEISEWAPLRPGEDAFIPAVLLMGLTAAAWVFSGRRRDFTQTVLVAITAWQSIAHLRHVPFFATVVGFWLAPHFDSLLDRLQRGRTADDPELETLPRWGRWVSGGLWVTAAALAAALFWQVREIRVKKCTYPVEAFQYMADHGLKGRMVVFFDWAQYAIYAFGEHSTVGFDGRFRTCYPQEIVDMHFDLVLGDMPGQRSRSPSSGPVDGTRVLEFGDPDLALITRKLPHAAIVMQEQDDWVLLYQDALAQLWGRAEKYDEPSSPDYLPPAQRRITDKPQAGYARWPALPQRNRSAVSLSSTARSGNES
jgi:hypothetical protein